MLSATTPAHAGPVEQAASKEAPYLVFAGGSVLNGVDFFGDEIRSQSVAPNHSEAGNQGGTNTTVGTAASYAGSAHFDDAAATVRFTSTDGSTHDNNVRVGTGGASAGGEVTLGQSLVSAQTTALDGAGCVPLGQPLAASYSEVQGAKLGSAVTLLGTGSSMSVTGTQKSPASTPGHDLRTVVSGSYTQKGLYEFLDADLMVEVTQRAFVEVSFDGINPARFHSQSATLRVTDSAGEATLVSASDGPVQFTAPGDTSRVLTLQVPEANESFSGPDGEGFRVAEASGAAFLYAVNDTEGQRTAFGTVGEVNAGARVGQAGVDCTLAGTPPKGTGDVDTDRDGLSDEREAVLGTDPNNPDTDGDSLADGREHNALKTDPLAKDTDRDGLSDGAEVKGFRNAKYGRVFTSNPLLRDSDNDGVSDRAEVTGSKNKKFKAKPTNPRKADTDGDKVSDGRELKAGSDPTDKKSVPRQR